jgi:hypothetical protein
MPIPATFPWVASQGIDDAIYTKMLRDDMDDPPIPVSESFSVASTVPFVRLNQYPSYDADRFLSVSSGSTQFQLVDNRLDILQPNQCYVEPETGYVYFQSASATAGVTINHYKVRWTNRRLINTLYAGLKSMFPRVWQRKTFVFQTAINQWEYQLSNDFIDPRCHPFRVESQEIPFSTTPYIQINNWRMVGLNMIKIPWSQEMSPGSNVRVHYAAPYNSLSELEPQVLHLPLTYAKGRLLMDKEILRVRFDLGPVAQNEQQSPVGTMQNAGLFFMQQFNSELERIARPLPMAAYGSTYAR